MPDPAPSYARGVRRPYADLPPAVQRWIEEQLGGPVTAVRDRVGGFSPGTAAVVSTAAGSGFVKAVGSVPNPTALELYRGERDRLAALPAHPAIVAPVGFADLEVDGASWAVTLFPAVPGEPPIHPWSAADAARVFDALGSLSADLSASVQTVPSTLEPSDQLVGFFDRWSEVAADPTDPWHTVPDLARFIEAEAVMQAALIGEVPTHTDLRADNLLLGPAATDGTPGPVWFVDWAAAQRAADWIDPAILACDLVVSRADRADGGSLDLTTFFAEHPTTAAIPAGLLWSTVVALAGALHRLGRRPDPPGLPTIRGWQRACAETLVAFARRTDL